MSSGERLPLAIVTPVAVKLRDTLAQACVRIEIAGSVRRQVPTISDIELVAIPLARRLEFGVPAERQVNALEMQLAELIDAGAIRRWPVDLARAAWGPKYKKFWLPLGQHWLQVDLYIVTRDNWGAQLVIRTGPQPFSKALVTHIRHKTPFVQDDGFLRVQVSGDIVPVPEETDYFAAVGVQWLEPVQRQGPDDIYPIRAFRRSVTVPAQHQRDDKQMSLF